MARKQPIGYEVMRPLTLWGKKRSIGEYIPVEEAVSKVRADVMVRSGRFKAVFEETDRGTVLRGRHGKSATPSTPAAPKPKRAYKRKVQEPE